MESDESWEDPRAVDSNDTEDDAVARELSTDAPSAEETQQNPRKRQAEPKFERKAKRAQRKSILNDYKQLLNIDINDTARGMLLDGERVFKRSWIGGNEWNSLEKRLFFGALDRLGKDNVAGIAQKVGTKSELEVQAYIQLLHEGVVNLHLNHPRQNLSSLDEIPAALEISEECSKALDEIADEVALHQQKQEVSRESKSHGDMWLLSQELISQELEERKGTMEDNLRELLPAVELLNLREWLGLSENIFMNSGGSNENDNWRNINSRPELPSIQATAFEDFHSVTINVLKRLVSTTIYCATSRLRASLPAEAQIRRQDVEAAVNMLGLKPNLQPFWVDCTRKYQLKVFANHKKDPDTQGPIPYNEVDRVDWKTEKQKAVSQIAVIDDSLADDQPSSDEDGELTLSGPKLSTTLAVADNDNGDDPAAIRVQDLASESIDMSLVDDVYEFSDSEPSTQSLPKRVHNQIILQNELERARDTYTEAFDEQASMIEEKRLWEMVKLEPPWPLESEEIAIPKRPIHHRKIGDELEDWRDNTIYWTDWELIKTPVRFADPSQYASETEGQTEMELETDNGNADASEGAEDDSSVELSDVEIDNAGPEGLEALLETGALSDQEEYSRIVAPDPPMRTKSTAQYRTRSRSQSVKSETTVITDDDVLSMRSVSTTRSMLTGDQKESRRQLKAEKKRARLEKKQKKMERGHEQVMARSVEEEEGVSNQYLESHLTCPVLSCKHHAKSMASLSQWKSHMKAHHHERDIIADEVAIKVAASATSAINSPLDYQDTYVNRSRSTSGSRGRSASRSAFRCDLEDCEQYGMGMSESNYKVHMRSHDFEMDDQEQLGESDGDVSMHDSGEDYVPREGSIEL